MVTLVVNGKSVEKYCRLIRMAKMVTRPQRFTPDEWKHESTE